MQRIYRQLATWLFRVFRSRRLPIQLRKLALRWAWRLAPIGGAADENNAQTGAGVTISYWDTTASPPAWALFGNVRSIKGVGTEKPKVQSTTLDSVKHQYIAGLGEPKELTVTSTGQELSTIMGLDDAGAALECKLDFPVPMDIVLYFETEPLGWEIGDIEPDSLIELDFKMQTTGAITTTPSHP